MASYSPRSTADQRAYEPALLEARWQRAWEENNTFATPAFREDRQDAYVFAACPFTSGDAHLGHIRSYTIADAHVRFRRARGDAVLFSLGFDAFGLPAELGAIEHGLPPAEWTQRCANRMRAQFDGMGYSFDWARTFATYQPDIYRWSQWLFVVLLEAGLVYQREAAVDWCDGCRTVLAGVQADSGECWRCHGPVRLVLRTQWYLRNTAYNRENESRLAGLEGWNKLAIAAQRTLLGRIDGVEIDAVAADGDVLTVFTPFPDAVGEAHFVALSPMHPEVDRWTGSEAVRDGLARLCSGALRRDDRALNQVRALVTDQCVDIEGVGRDIPVIISPSVDARYGPTAVLGIPVKSRSDAALASMLPGAKGITASTRTTPKMRPATRFRAADFPISRQRAWGAPIPLVHCSSCGTVPVPVQDLPVLLPDDLVVTGEGNALAARDDFVECECPSCGQKARRETDTLDCHMDAAWMEIPIAVPARDRATKMFTHPELQRWLPTAQFVHGADTGGFVLDERTVAKALRDLGIFDFLPAGEPYGGALMHEMIQLGGRKMSKHLGNVVSPAKLVDEVGADALRFAALHAAAPGKSFSWTEGSIQQAVEFLARLWSYAEPRLKEAAPVPADAQIQLSNRLRRRLDSWCATAYQRISENFQTLEMHRATRNLMTLLSRVEDFEARAVLEHRNLVSRDRDAVTAALTLLIQLLSPIAPHISEELWQRSGQTTLLSATAWPVWPSKRAEMKAATQPQAV